MDVSTLLPRRWPQASSSDRFARARTDLTGEFSISEVCGEPDPPISRSNSAPAYYQGRPASLWISVMKPRRLLGAGPARGSRP
jgi:hypothetical protein